MKSPMRKLAALLLSICLLLFPKSAKADTLQNDARDAVIAIVAVTAVITVAIVYAIRHDPSIKGCATSGLNGLTLTNEGNQETFRLTGDTATIKPGDRVKVTGKKKKKDAAATRNFVVTKFNKDYGACKVTP
ncbi:MAG TPA: hypothetical protein VF865_17625 [Acidobacteriaceae bacterium]